MVPCNRAFLCALLFRCLRSPAYPVRTFPHLVGRFTVPPPCFESAVWCECGFKFHHWLVRNTCAPADRMVCGPTPTFSKVSSSSVSPGRAFGRHSWYMGTTAKHLPAVDRVLELWWSWPSCSQEKRVGAFTKSPSDPIRLLLLRMYSQYHSTLVPKKTARMKAMAFRK